jgi:gliding motility-associated protein GldE
MNLTENPKQLSVALLISKIFVNSALIFYFIFIIFPPFNPMMNIDGLSSKLVLCGIILLFILFFQLIPRLIAYQYPAKFVQISIAPVCFMYLFMSPISRLMILVSSFIVGVFGKKKQEISISDLSNVLENDESTTDENKKILEGIVSYGSIDACEIMKPRVDVVAFDISISFEELLRKIKQYNHSRIPIFSETFDNIKGVLYVKDLLPHFHKKVFNWQTLIRPAYFVPESKKINDLLLDFQTKKNHMALVIDEYGGTSGIVTLEDILEEIVGEIIDELDYNNEYYKKIDENNYIFEGKTLLNDFYKILEMDDAYFNEIRGDAETLAGMILEMNGEIPKIGTNFTFKQFTFTIISSDKRRIKQIRLTKNDL